MLVYSLFYLTPSSCTLLGATTPGQSGPVSNGNEGVLHIPQISRAGASPSDSLVSYPGYKILALNKP